jgi:hypothetical protein
VAEDGAVFHQAVLQEDLLAGLNVEARENNVSVWSDNAPWNRRLTRVSAIGEQTEHEKTKEEHDDDGLNPALRDQQLTPPGCVHLRISS